MARALSGLTLYRDFPFSQDSSVFIVDEFNAGVDGTAGGAKGVNEEQTASLQTVLLHGPQGLVVRTQIRTAQRGSIPFPWTSTIRATKG